MVQAEPKAEDQLIVHFTGADYQPLEYVVPYLNKKSGIQDTFSALVECIKIEIKKPDLASTRQTERAVEYLSRAIKKIVEGTTQTTIFADENEWAAAEKEAYLTEKYLLLFAARVSKRGRTEPEKPGNHLNLVAHFTKAANYPLYENMRYVIRGLEEDGSIKEAFIDLADAITVEIENPNFDTRVNTMRKGSRLQYAIRGSAAGEFYMDTAIEQARTAERHLFMHAARGYDLNQ